MNAFKRGYDNYFAVCGAGMGAQMGNAYVGNVQEQIDILTKAMNDPIRRVANVPIDKLKGFVAEWWHAGTYNIDAAVKGNSIKADAIDDNGIVDIKLNNGDDCQLKYYKTAEDSAKAQAISNLEHHKNNESALNGKAPHDPYYGGQYRLIPSDQLHDAEQKLKLWIEKAKMTRPDQAKRYEDTLAMLTDRIKTSDGSESIPLSKEESELLAEIVKEQGFDPADFGLTTELLIKPEYVLNQALKAGLSAAIVSLVLKIGPDICGIITKLIKEGEIDAEQFKKLGFDAVSGSVEGFIRGGVSAALTTACKAGLLGAAMKTANPNIIGAATALAMNTIKNSCLLAFGRISKQEFVKRCGQDLVITACSVGVGIAGAAVASALFTPAAAMVGYMVGSFVGSVVGSFVFKGIEYCVISFCVATGSTFFGLVEQDYTLPDEVLEHIGVEVFTYKIIKPEQVTYSVIAPESIDYKVIVPEKIGITFLRRGVIGVGKVGYVPV